jgi:hypothetical protein
MYDSTVPFGLIASDFHAGRRFCRWPRQHFDPEKRDPAIPTPAHPADAGLMSPAYDCAELYFLCKVDKLCAYLLRIGAAFGNNGG